MRHVTDHDNVAPADWYRDPADPALLRWWDGMSWTTHVHSLGAGPSTASHAVRGRRWISAAWWVVAAIVAPAAVGLAWVKGWPYPMSGSCDPICDYLAGQRRSSLEYVAVTVAIAEVVIAAIVWRKPEPHRLAITAGVVGIILSVIPDTAPAGLGLGVVAVASSLAHLPRRAAVSASRDARGEWIAGRVLGIAAIVVGAAWMLLFFAIGDSNLGP